MKARGGIKGCRPWYKKWFVIDDHGLTWYSDEAAAKTHTKVGGRVPMHLLISASPHVDKGETRFVLQQKLPRGGGSVDVHLSAESAALMHRWLELIKRHLNERNDGLCYGGGAGTSGEGAQAKAAAQEGPSADGKYVGEQVERRLGLVAGNEACADCVTSDPAKFPNKPTWGSTNLGVVFCIRCSGIHRKLGAHITKVLSLQIDGWSEEQMEAMEAKGNALVNAELEAALPEGYAKPDCAACDATALEIFIRSKYELGSFKPGGDGKLADVKATLETKAMDEFCGLLVIRLLRGTDLPAKDTYVEFFLGERKSKSNTVKNSANPSWNSTLFINVRSLKETLILKLFDAGSALGGPTFVGQALVPLEDLTHDGQPIGMQLSLDGGKNGKKGHAATVAVELTYNPLTS